MRITVLSTGIICLAAVAQVAHGPAAMAQTPTILAPGTRIRVTAPSALTPEQQAGRLVALRADSLLLQPDGAAEVTIPRSAIGEIDTSLGRHSATGRGIVVGLFTGAAAGAALGAALLHKGACTFHQGVLFLPAYTSDCVSRGTRAAEGGILGAVAGLVAGGLIGHSHKTEDWHRVGGFAGSVLRIVPDHLSVASSGAAVEFSLRI
jgi:hypothetical protein